SAGATANVTQGGGVNTLGSRTWDGSDLPPPNGAGEAFANNVSLIGQSADNANAVVDQNGILNRSSIDQSNVASAGVTQTGVYNTSVINQSGTGSAIVDQGTDGAGDFARNASQIDQTGTNGLAD